MGRNTLKFDGNLFDEYIEKLESLGADMKPVIMETLTFIGEEIGDDTADAVQKKYLPAKGKYSSKDDDTMNSVIREPKPVWTGTGAEVGVGFDYLKPGHGGYLITGTPRMDPDEELKKMYKGKRYMKQINSHITEMLEDAIEEHMGG